MLFATGSADVREMERFGMLLCKRLLHEKKKKKKKKRQSKLMVKSLSR